MRYLIVLLLTGCVAWDKPGSTEESFQRDMYECEKDAAPVQNRIDRAHMVERCMKVKGWQLVPK